MVGKKKTQKEYLRVNIDMPLIQMNITTNETMPALKELRRILEALHLDEEIVYEEFVAEELKRIFSDPFVKNEQVMKMIKKLLKQETDYRVATAEIPSVPTLDLQNESQAVHVQRKDVRSAIISLATGIESTYVKQGIVHINGELDREGKMLIVDHVHKHMPTAQLRAFHSKGAVGKVTVECIFFGDFPDEE